MYSSWYKDQAIRIWDRETDQTQTLKIQGDGPFAFRPDGTPWQLTKLAADGRALVLQDLARETPLRQFRSPRQDRPFVSAMAMTPSGSHVAGLFHASEPVLGTDPPENAPPDLIVVWDALSGAVIRAIDLAAPAFELALAPDGRLVAVGDWHGNIALWTLPDGAPYATLSAGDNRIQCLAFGREPRVSFRQKPGTPPWQLASGDGGGTVTLFDLRNKRIRNIGRGSPYDINALVFRPDGAVLVSVGRGFATLWDVATGDPMLRVDAGNTQLSVAFSPDGRRLAVGRSRAFSSTDGVMVFDLREGRSIRSLFGLETLVSRPVFSRDGKLVAALSDDWQAGIWDRQSGRLLHIFLLPPGLFADNAGLTFDPTGGRIAVSAHEHATLWDTETGRLIQSWKLSPGLQDNLAFHGPDQLFLFRAETRDRVPPFSNYHPKDHPRVYRLYNLLGPSPLKPVKEILDHDWYCNGILMPVDGRFFITNGASVKDGRKTQSIVAYDGTTGATLWSMPSPRAFGDDAPAVSLDPSGSILLLGHPGGNRSTWLKLPGREFITEMERWPPLLSPDGKRWFSPEANTTATTRLEWYYYPDGGRGRRIGFAERGDTARCLVFAPDSRHVAWGGSKYDVVVCDLVELQRAMAEYQLGW
jgi:WD40 repeat protein